MEGTTFRDSAVAELLSNNFVEARMHLEHFRQAGGKIEEQFDDFQTKYAESPAMPTYVVLDPTSMKRVGWHQLTGVDGLQFEGEILQFLNEALASGKPGRVKTARAETR